MSFSLHPWPSPTGLRKTPSGLPYPSFLSMELCSHFCYCSGFSRQYHMCPHTITAGASSQLNKLLQCLHSILDPGSRQAANLFMWLARSLFLPVVLHGLGLGRWGHFAGSPNSKPFTSNGLTVFWVLSGMPDHCHFLVKGHPCLLFCYKKLWGGRPYNRNKSFFQGQNRKGLSQLVFGFRILLINNHHYIVGVVLWSGY